MATVSDRKLPVPTPGNATVVGSYKAEIISLADYSPFGMTLQGRSYAGTYRYGFNGKDEDIETGWQDYGFRIYDKSLGRFLSVDPLMSEYAGLTPYQFASNRPIDGIDLDGLEWFKKDNTSYLLEYKRYLTLKMFSILPTEHLPMYFPSFGTAPWEPGGGE